MVLTAKARRAWMGGEEIFVTGYGQAINYLHERPVPVLHRDLKSLNLLLDHNKRVKLTDWTKGLENYMTGKIGTYQWMALR